MLSPAHRAGDSSQTSTSSVGVVRAMSTRRLAGAGGRASPGRLAKQAAAAGGEEQAQRQRECDTATTPGRDKRSENSAT